MPKNSYYLMFGNEARWSKNRWIGTPCSFTEWRTKSQKSQNSIEQHKQGDIHEKPVPKTKR